MWVYVVCDGTTKNFGRQHGWYAHTHARTDGRTEFSGHVAAPCSPCKGYAPPANGPTAARTTYGRAPEDHASPTGFGNTARARLSLKHPVGRPIATFVVNTTVVVVIPFSPLRRTICDLISYMWWGEPYVKRFVIAIVVFVLVVMIKTRLRTSRLLEI